MATRRTPRPAQAQAAESYQHKTADSPMRPDVGTQAQFKKRKPPKTYRYDTSLDPALSWDEGNGSRGLGEWLLARISDAARLPAPHLFPEPQRLTGADGKTLATVRGLEDAVEQLKAIERPFLNWAGKAERLNFDVPTLPLFIHERLSTKAILETLKGHKREGVDAQMDLFGDPHHSVVDQTLRAYEHRDRWVNRMILGDSLAVMNSLVEYEGMRGQVQMIYMDPPYGVKFGSNFQPFVRKRDVSHNDDEDMTREPEMVQAYRDTWELGLHSYLTYLRDRLLLARELLTPSGSVFVQISDENLHHVRELMDEVFGSGNFVVIICYRRLGMMVGETLQSSAHYLLWYAKDKERLKARKLFERQIAGIGTGDHYTQIEEAGTGHTRPMTIEERANPELVPRGWKPFQLISLTTGGYRPNTTIDYVFEGRIYNPGPNKCWRTTKDGLDRLTSLRRITATGSTLRYKQLLDDFPLTETTTIWEDTARDVENFYVVQTPSNVVRRCVLMTTDPGDLVLDPTCGSGTSAYVAEQSGRRWITIDASRVPLALARQRLLTATFPWYELVDEGRGPAGGFVYKRWQNKKGEEVGGIVPHVTLKSIANNEPPDEEILVDRPEENAKITRVSGAFCVEATIPTAADLEGMNANPEAENVQAAHEETAESFIDRMLEILRRSPLLRLPGNRNVELTNIRKPAKSLSLQAEALVAATAEGQEATIADAADEALEASGGLLGGLTKRPVAFLFGPENGAINQKAVMEAAMEARLKSYTHLYVIGFAIHPNARQFVENCEAMAGIRATYVQMTPDVLMGDLLKNMRSSQIFSVCGLPEVELRLRADGKYEVELLGLDVFDPATMESSHEKGDDVPAWFLDTDYNGLCFHVSQAFFPRTSAWEGLKKALKADYEETVWDHLAGTVSAPFEPNGQGEIAVKVIDDRGNELMVTRKIREAKKTA
ncbi:MAG: DNA methyltransferase [Terracidiphilus sp.]|jgi:adenine-specific DNA-methyltransferase